RAWQQRPLDDVYPVIFLDALVLKIREGGTVQRRACYLALRARPQRRRVTHPPASPHPGELTGHQRGFLMALDINEEAARKLIYLAIVNAVPQWSRSGSRALLCRPYP